MQIQTHLIFGWCVGQSLPLTKRERLCCVIAAEAADFDGLGLIISWDYYYRFHHILGHNILAWFIIPAILCAISGWRWFSYLVYFLLFASHLLFDSFGSGPGWGLALLWPFNKDYFFFNSYAWEFQGWQNILALFLFSSWAALIFLKNRKQRLLQK